MRRLLQVFWLTHFLLFVAFVSAAEIRVKDKVVAIHDIDILLDEMKVGRAYAGVPIEVKDVNDGFVLVPGTKAAGWLKSEDVVSLSDALPYFSARIEKDPSNWEALRARGTLLSLAEKLKPAEVDFDAALRLNPRDAQSWERRGFLRLLRKEYPGAISDFSEWVTLKPDSDRPFLSRAMARTAKAGIAKVTISSGEINIGLTLPDEYLHPFAENEVEQVLADLATVLRIDPNYNQIYLARCMIYTNEQDFDRALAEVSEYLRLEPKVAYAYQARGRLWIKKKNYTKALVDLDEALRLKPNDAQTYRWRGLVGLETNDLDQSIADLSKAIILDPKVPNPYVKRGFAYSRKNELPKALLDFDQAIELDPKVAAPWIGRAKIWIKLKEIDKALLDLNEGIRLDSKEARCLALRGGILDSLGKRKEAIEDVREAVRLNPSSPDFSATLAYLLSSQPHATANGERDEALALAQFACKQTDWKNSDCIQVLAAVFAERGDFSAAAESQSKAVSISVSKGEKSYREKVLQAFKRKKTYRESPLKFR